MQFKKNLVQKVISQYPNLKRKDQYRIIKAIVKHHYGIFIEEEICREICNLQRAIRSVMPREATTKELEEQAKKELGYAVETKKKINSLFE